MKVFVINLKRSVERRQRIESALHKQNIEFEFIEAVDSSTPDFIYSNRRDDGLSLKRLGHSLVTNEVACFASHYLAWEKCLAVGQPIIVLEDNCDLTIDFSNYIGQLEVLAKKYDYLKLCAAKKRLCYYTLEKINDLFSVVRFLKSTTGARGYVLTPTAADRFIKGADKFVEPVDDYMDKTYKHGVITYSIKPDLIKRARIPSTIGAKRKVKVNLTIRDKIYIELFRVYEQIGNIIAVLKGKQ